MKQVHMKTTLAFPKEIEEKQNQYIKCLHGTKTKELIAKNGSSIFLKRDLVFMERYIEAEMMKKKALKLKRLIKINVFMYRTLTYQYYKRCKTKDKRFLGLM